MSSADVVLPAANDASTGFAERVALAIVGLALLTQVFAVFTFAVGRGLSPWTLPGAVIGGTIGLWRLCRGTPRGAEVTALGAMAVAVATLVVGGAVGNAVLDLTWDGRWYHRDAVVLLAEGWNPLAGEVTPEEVPDAGARERINGYPKGPWILASSVVAVTGRIETGSAFSLALLVAAGAATFAAVRRIPGVGRNGAAAVAGIVALNPVAVCQLTSPLVDGQLASLIAIVIAAAFSRARTGSVSDLVLLAAAIAVGVNIKHSALPFISIILSGLLIVHLAVARRLPTRATLAGVVAALVAGSVGIGFHPYATNLVRYQSWAYPHERSTVSGHQAPALGDARIGRLEAFVTSVYSRPRHAPSLWDSRSELISGTSRKPLFNPALEDLLVFRVDGVRIGGWGPLFGEMLLVAGLAMAVLAIGRPRRAAVALAAVGVVAVSVLAFPYPWVYRLVPHSWLLPLIPAAACLGCGRRSVSLLAWFVLVLGAANIALVVVVYGAGAVQSDAFIRKRIAHLADRGEVAVNVGGLRAEMRRLVEHGVEARRSDDPHDWLGVSFGWAQPVAISTEYVSSGSGEEVEVRWAPVHGARFYELEVFEAPPAGPGGGGLHVYSAVVDEPHTRFPISATPVSFTVTACNALGCGPRALRGPLSGTGVRRPQPIIGLPRPGAEVVTPVLISWFPADPGERHVVRIIDAETGEIVIEEWTGDNFLSATLPTYRSWRTTVSLSSGGVDETTSRVVEFRTTSTTAPEPLEPAPGSTVTEGDVTLRWSAVHGAGSYEYLVMEPGGRRPAARGVTDRLTWRAQLRVHGKPTRFSLVVRACPEDELCRPGRDDGWGMWSTEASTGAATFTVVPDES